MPETFTVFNARNRDVNVQYNSATYTIPADTTDKMVKFTLDNIDMVAEPETTVVYWAIELDDGSGWRHMVSGDIIGRGGVEQPRNPGTIATSIGGIKGHDVRGSLYFVSANDQRKRFGVVGETY